MSLRCRIGLARMRWREHRAVLRDVTDTASLVLAVLAFFTLIAAVCVAVFVLNA
jgi:hypothetical protein